MLYAALTPLLPHFRREFDISKGGVGVLAAGFAIGVLVAAIPGGIIAARFGARAAVIGGLSLITLASVGVALADSFALLFSARFLQGLGSSVTAGPFRMVATIWPYGCFSRNVYSPAWNCPSSCEPNSRLPVRSTARVWPVGSLRNDPDTARPRPVRF